MCHFKPIRMAFVQAHFSSPHSSRRPASLADFRHQDTRTNSTLSEPARTGYTLVSSLHQWHEPNTN